MFSLPYTRLSGFSGCGSSTQLTPAGYRSNAQQKCKWSSSTRHVLCHDQRSITQQAGCVILWRACRWFPQFVTIIRRRVSSGVASCNEFSSYPLVVPSHRSNTDSKTTQQKCKCLHDQSRLMPWPTNWITPQQRTAYVAKTNSETRWIRLPPCQLGWRGAYHMKNWRGLPQKLFLILHF
jgi:hypothetical protein